MNQSQLLDNLARAIDAPRGPGRLKNIKKAFAEYTALVKQKRKWWQFLLWGKE